MAKEIIGNDEVGDNSFMNIVDCLRVVHVEPQWTVGRDDVGEVEFEEMVDK